MAHPPGPPEQRARRAWWIGLVVLAGTTVTVVAASVAVALAHAREDALPRHAPGADEAAGVGDDAPGADA